MGVKIIWVCFRDVEKNNKNVKKKINKLKFNSYPHEENQVLG